MVRHPPPRIADCASAAPCTTANPPAHADRPKHIADAKATFEAFDLDGDSMLTKTEARRSPPAQLRARACATVATRHVLCR